MHLYLSIPSPNWILDRHCQLRFRIPHPLLLFLLLALHYLVLQLVLLLLSYPPRPLILLCLRLITLDLGEKIHASQRAIGTMLRHPGAGYRENISTHFQNL